MSLVNILLELVDDPELLLIMIYYAILEEDELYLLYLLSLPIWETDAGFSE